MALALSDKMAFRGEGGPERQFLERVVALPPNTLTRTIHHYSSPSSSSNVCRLITAIANCHLSRFDGCGWEFSLQLRSFPIMNRPPCYMQSNPVTNGLLMLNQPSSSGFSAEGRHVIAWTVSGCRRHHSAIGALCSNDLQLCCQLGGRL